MLSSGPSSTPASQPTPPSLTPSVRSSAPSVRSPSPSVRSPSPSVRSPSPSVRNLGLPAPAEGAWLWLAHEMERVLDAAREATGLAHPGFTVVRVLEAGVETDTVLGWANVEAADVRVVDAGRIVAAQLVNVPEGAPVDARDAHGRIAGRVLFRCHLELEADGRLRAVDTAEGRLERRGDGRWRLFLGTEAGPPSFRHPPRTRAAA